MEAVWQHLARTEGVRQLQAAESLLAPVRDRQTRRPQAEMEWARSLQADTKEDRLLLGCERGSSVPPSRTEGALGEPPPLAPAKE